MATHKIIRTFERAGDTPVISTIETTASGEINVSESIAAETTDQFIPMQIDYSALKSLYIKASAAVTIETNSGSAAADTIALPANKAYEWVTGDVAPCLITEDVTPGIYVTTPAGSAVTFEFRALQDATS